MTPTIVTFRSVTTGIEQENNQLFQWVIWFSIQRSWKFCQPSTFPFNPDQIEFDAIKEESFQKIVDPQQETLDIGPTVTSELNDLNEELVDTKSPVEI